MSTAITSRPSTHPLPSTLTLGPVEIGVSDIERSLAWYQSALGLHVRAHDGTRAELGDEDVTSVVLVEQPGARAAGRHAGLYHYALLYPTREDLARAALRLIARQTGVQGASDHGTHEAIYLGDPDGNGIELAADRPRSQWPTPEEEFGAGGPRPLDLHALLATVDGEAVEERIRAGLRVGHLHLHVGSVEEGLRFYSDVLGFDVWAQIPTAAFVSAGGYHHHLGFNVWRGEGVPPAPADAVGLRRWTIQLPDRDAVDRVAARLEAAGYPVERGADGFTTRDPWQIPLRVEFAA